jgi:superfamily II DNA or RNA helicase
LRAYIDSSIRIPIADVPPDVWHQLQPELSIPNREKETARREKRYGWTEMPDEIELWDFDDEHLIVPRGFRDPLERGLEALGVDVEWIDRRTSDRMLQVWPPFESYRSFQPTAAQRMIDLQEGIVEAPAGSGKTVMVLEAVRRARQRHNLIIVNEIGIAEQWLEEAHDFLGPDFGYGLVGGGQWTEGRLTIATVQTLYARREDLSREWKDRWGFVVLDECHHQTAATFIEVMQMFPALIRGGTSATPDKTGDFDFAQAVLGDVIFRVTRQELREEGILMRPTIRVVDTEFSYPYYGTHDATRAHDYECLKPGCNLSGKRRHGHRNNYSSMLKALVEDEDRNLLIASNIFSRRGHRQIVVSKQTNQLNHIRRAMEAFGHPGEVLWLTGDVSPEMRRVAKRTMMDNDDVVLLTTIADEAFNVPPLDTLHMPFPTRNTGAIRQRVGRVERVWPNKEDPLVFDYRDPIGVLRSQYRQRYLEVYVPEMYRMLIDERREAA